MNYGMSWYIGACGSHHCVFKQYAETIALSLNNFVPPAFPTPSTFCHSI